MGEIHNALKEGSAAALGRAAHTLKGSAGNFGARAVVQRALELEMTGKRGELSGAETAYAALEEEMARLKEALRKSVDSVR
jgi:HPt (histidine-containing phosphotransfer) domain-containing protein